MIPLLSFISMVITLYMWVIIIGAILSWLIAFDVINRRNQVVYMIADSLHRITEPALRPIRRYMPDLGGIDISPVILILVLIFLRDVVIGGWIAPAFI
jgi:YggT family protein